MQISKTVGAIVVTLSTAFGANAGSTGAAADWNGFYAGLQGARADGELSAYNSGVYSFDLFTDGNLYGAFAGYNLQRGQMVYGGELSYFSGTLSDSSHTLTTDKHIDLKARVGFATGKALFYGFAGYSNASMTESPGAVVMPVSGMNYGIGMDYKISDRFFLGAEYMVRDMSGSFDQVAFPGWTTSGNINTISVRAGISF